MSEPNSAPDQTPEVPKAPSFTYDSPGVPAAPAAPAAPPAAEPTAPPAYGERIPGYQYPPAQPLQQAPGVPAYSAPAPGYGAPDAYGAPAYGAQGYGPPVKKRRTWDLVLTIILLVLGLGGMSIGLIYAALFSDPALLKQIFDQALSQYGLGGWNGSVGSAATVIAISHLLLYLVALGVSILLLVKRRVAFWVPLSAGVLAAVIFWGAFYSVMLSDPALLSGLS